MIVILTPPSWASVSASLEGERRGEEKGSLGGSEKCGKVAQVPLFLLLDLFLA